MKFLKDLRIGGFLRFAGRIFLRLELTEISAGNFFVRFPLQVARHHQGSKCNVFNFYYFY